MICDVCSSLKASFSSGSIRFFFSFVQFSGYRKACRIIDRLFVFVVYAYNFLFGLSAAALYAAVVIPNKRVEPENVYETTVTRLVAAAVVMIPYLLLTEDFSAVTVNVTAVGVVQSEGIVHTGIAYALHFGSMKT